MGSLLVTLRQYLKRRGWRHLAGCIEVRALKVKELPDVLLRVPGLDAAQRGFLEILERRKAPRAHDIRRSHHGRDGVGYRTEHLVAGHDGFGGIWVPRVAGDHNDTVVVEEGVFLLELLHHLLVPFPLRAVLALGTVVRLGQDLLYADD
jgi:hypothetical protein